MAQQTLSTQPHIKSNFQKRQPYRKIGIFSLKLSLAAFTALLVLLIYSSSLNGPFLFDDGNNIQDNPCIRMTRLTWEGLKRAGFESPPSHRPIANMTFALNYYLGGYRVVGYRMLNILIHIFGGLLLYLFLYMNGISCRILAAAG